MPIAPADGSSSAGPRHHALPRPLEPRLGPKRGQRHERSHQDDRPGPREQPVGIGRSQRRRRSREPSAGPGIRAWPRRPARRRPGQPVRQPSSRLHHHLGQGLVALLELDRISAFDRCPEHEVDRTPGATVLTCRSRGSGPRQPRRCAPSHRSRRPCDTSEGACRRSGHPVPDHDRAWRLALRILVAGASAMPTKAAISITPASPSSQLRCRWRSATCLDGGGVALRPERSLADRRRRRIRLLPCTRSPPAPRP